jgi:flagellar hook-basal body complex protein FliE
MTTMPILHAAHALSAYQSIDGKTPAASVSGGGDFASLLSKSLGGAIDTGQQAESQALSALHGGGDLSSVVTAVSRAELTLQTTVAVRDRVLQAYQDIIKMPI